MKYILTIAIFVFLLTISQTPSLAQTETPVECGTIIEDEFVGDGDSNFYSIELDAGSILNIDGVPLGDTLQFTIALFEPDGRIIYLGAQSGGTTNDGTYWNVVPNPRIETGILSARGTYTFVVYNNSIQVGGDYDYVYHTGDRRYTTPGGSGIYTLLIGCTLRDGTVIEPGETVQQTTDDGSTTSATTIDETDSGLSNVANVEVPEFGFPGLAPVDFSNGVTVPLQAEAPNSGSISPDFEGIFGYAFSGSAGETVTLDFERQSGNLNLGLVVLSADNQVAFQASLLNSNSLTTEFALPEDGDYTIGVFPYVLG